MTQADENARRGRAARAGSADADLVLRSRSGDRAAYAELWRRHYRSGITVARSITSTIDADDLVQEAYTKIYQSILKGGGPTGSFRAYLFTAIRNTAAGWGRARRETPIDELDAVEDPATTEAATAEALDRGLTHQAFRSLPSRWQEVLWYAEIEQMKPAEIAPLLGMRATAVAQLAFRAREGLREAWIQAHLRSVADGSDCQWVISRQGASARGNLGSRDRARFNAHLADCTRCTIVTAEAKDVSGRLALILLPLTVGSLAAGGYLAAVQGHGAPVVALAAMPSEVIEGAVAAGSVVAVGGSVAGTTGTSSGGTAAATGSLWGIGALVGAGVASVAIASVVVAAVLIPGVGGSSGVSPAAAFSDGQPAATIEPDPELIEDPVAEPLPDEESRADEPAPEPRAKRPSLPDRGLVNYIVAPKDEPSDAAPEPPATDDSPNDEGDGGVGAEDPIETDPVDPPNPVDPPDTVIEGFTPPTQEGNSLTIHEVEHVTYFANNPSALEGRGAETFAADSEMTASLPEEVSPGRYTLKADVTITATVESGYTFPSGKTPPWTFTFNEPDTDPEVAPLAVVSSSWEFDDRCRTVISIGVIGEPGAAVHAYLHGDPDDSATLDRDGSGTLHVRPTGPEMYRGVVDIRYEEAEFGDGMSRTISTLAPDWRLSSWLKCLAQSRGAESAVDDPVAEDQSAPESISAPAEPTAVESTPGRSPAAEPAPAPAAPPAEPAPAEPAPAPAAPAPSEPTPTPSEPAPTAPAPQTAPDSPALTADTEPATGELAAE